ncbi:btb/poz domain-containing [Anaeramoeba flamelloides]|uniref:Btb/poz domain-containing n=1 Tax=Anaeramoeba flamelloides TaxID=1746091 RepID=A0AAV8A1X5_9EUKA|nr:btb/poz domain-containing [Anaeramoeba flamelloides]
MSRIEQTLQKLINSKTYSDVKFSIGKEKKIVYSHRLILAASSKYFSELFYPTNTQIEEEEEEEEKQKEKQKKEIGLPFLIQENCSYRLFLKFLKFFYTYQVDILSSNATQLLELSLKYEVDLLFQQIYDYINNHLSKFNCLKLFEISTKYKCKELIEKLTKYLETHSEKVLKPKCLISLSKMTIQELLKLDQIRIKEIDFFDLVYEWAEDVINIEMRENGEQIITNEIKSRRISELLKDVLPLVRSELFGTQGRIRFNRYNLQTITIEDKIKSAGYQSIKNIDFSNCKTAILAADSSDKHRSNVINHITKKGYEVTTFCVSKERISYQQISQFDVFFVYSEEKFMNSKDEIGDLLAQIVENGKGLVICSQNCLTLGAPGIIGGRFLTEGFSPFQPQEENIEEEFNLGEITEFHPIMEGVKTFEGGMGSAHSQFAQSKDINTKTICCWENGRPLITTKKNNDDFGMVVVLNLSPISNEVGDEWFWKKESDGDKIIVNSLKFVYQHSQNK